MTNENIETLVNVQFPLDKALPQLKPKSVRRSDQVTSERITNKELRGAWVATIDFPMYHIDRKEAFFDLSGINPGFENSDDFCRQIRETNNYHPSKKDVRRVMNAKSTITAPLSKLDLIKDTDEWYHFEIDTSKDGNQFNKYQRPLAERAFGNMESSSIGREECDFNEYMNLLKTKGISTTRFFVLNPEYVMEHAKKGPIARVSRLDYFDDDSDFDAVDRNIDNSYICLRGVPVSAVGATREKTGIQIPKQILSALEKGNGFQYNEIIYVPTSASNVKLK